VRRTIDINPERQTLRCVHYLRYLPLFCPRYGPNQHPYERVVTHSCNTGGVYLE